MQAFLKNRVGGVKLNPTYETLQMFLASGTFTAPITATYCITVVGRSGDGGKTSNYSGAGGGGSGGLAVSVLKLKKGASIPVTVTVTVSSFGDYLSATAGQNGKDTTERYVGSDGGAGGTATGGNVLNMNGFAGGRGADAGDNTTHENMQAASGANGENQGMTGGLGGYTWGFLGGSGGSAGISYSGGGGGGGARLPDDVHFVAPTLADFTAATGCSYNDHRDNTAKDADEYPRVFGPENLTLYGGGGGQAGQFYYANPNNDPNYGVGGAPSQGTPGIVIIEIGV